MTLNMGSQLRWLERTPDKREVDGSIPFEPTTKFIKKLRVFKIWDYKRLVQGKRGEIYEIILNVYRKNFDEVIGSLKYIDEKEGKLEELVAKVLGLDMAQQKRAVQGNRAKKLEIVLNVHRKLMSED